MKVAPKAILPNEIYEGLCYLRISGSNHYITSEYDKLNGMGITRGIQYATVYTKEVATLISKLSNLDLQIEDFKG
ncbi:MAG: hypothetical protein WCJ62_12275 [Flavobacterium sp.]